MYILSDPSEPCSDAGRSRAPSGVAQGEPLAKTPAHQGTDQHACLQSAPLLRHCRVASAEAAGLRAAAVDLHHRVASISDRESKWQPGLLPLRTHPSPVISRSDSVRSPASLHIRAAEVRRAEGRLDH
eukprot:6515302-Prymnesium_polylepis.1